MHGLKIRLDESRQDVVLIELEGRLDSHTFEELETLFEGLFQRDKHRLMVDLNKLQVNSSAGAGVFIGALGICQENDGNVALIRPNPAVREMFDLLGVFHIFLIASSPEEALLVLNN